jgi:putative peptidoglycan lipid II flippase
MKKLKSGVVVSIATFISRVLGLVRDGIIARVFGISPTLDAFLVAFKIPNFFRRLFAEGAFSQAVMPVLAEGKHAGDEQVIINHITGRLLSVLLIVTLIGVIASPVIIFAFAWGFYFEDSNQFYVASDLLKITFPYLLFISVTAFFGGILNTHNNFLIPAITPVLLNIAIIVASIFLAPHLEQPIFGLAWGVLIGGVAQLLLQLPFLIKIGKLPKPTNKPHKVFKTLKQRMLPAIFGLSVSQINLLIDTMIASTLVAGSISWLYYANRLLELPLALVGVAIGVVSVAKLSGYFAENNTEKFTQTIDNSLHYALVFGIPAGVGLVLVASPLMLTLFAYGNFTITDGYNAASALIAYGVGVVFFILIKVMVPIFLSRGDTRTPVVAGVVAMVSNIALNIILSNYYGFIGIAIATSISAVLNVVVLVFFIIKNNLYSFNFKTLKTTIKVLISSAFMGIFLWFFELSYTTGAATRVMNLALEVGIAAMIYFIFLLILRVKFL